jgi:outer membrane protein assembly factor BamB
MGNLFRAATLFAHMLESSLGPDCVGIRMKSLRLAVLPLLLVLVAPPLPRDVLAATNPLPPWVTYHHDLARTGVDPTGPTFGSAYPGWTSPQLDGPVYTEPLLAGTNVFVATENDTVYSLDATTGAIVWTAHLGTPVAANTSCSSIPFDGITATPVIDLANGIIYVVMLAQPGHNALVALALGTGTVLWWKVVDPPQDDPIQLRSRSALVLSQGMIYISYASRDCGIYHGWVQATSAIGNGPVSSFMVPLPPGYGSSLWAPSGPAVDSAGNLFVVTSNSYGSTSYDYSDSVLKLSPTLQLLDSFAPPNWQQLNALDLDLGSVGPVLLANGLVFVVGKQGIGYLLQANHLGGINGQLFAGPICAPGSDGAYGGAAYLDPYIFVPCAEGLVALKLGAGPSFSVAWRGPIGTTPGAPVVSGGVVWIMSREGYLYALDPVTGGVRYVSWPGPTLTHFPSLSAGVQAGSGVAVGQLFVTLGKQIANYAFTATPAQPVGGHNFSISLDASGSRVFTWTGGTAQTSYRLNLLGGASVTLPGSATSYMDASALPQTLPCYQLISSGPTGLLGISDILCAWPGSQSAGAAPSGFTMSLNGSPAASLSWIAPAGQTAYVVGAYPMNGSSPRYTSLPGTATSATDDLESLPTCYVVFAVVGSTFTGHTPALCSSPGTAILP